MEGNEMQRFVSVEIKKIEIEKWLEGEKCHFDPTDEFVLEWIKTSAAEFRSRWDESVCKHCVCWNQCGYELKEECCNFKEDG